MNEDERVCDTCGATTDINDCWTDCGMYWCSDECVPKWKWIQMFGKEMNNEQSDFRKTNAEGYEEKRFS